MFSFEKRKLWSDLTAAFQYFKGVQRKDGRNSLSMSVVKREGIMLLNYKKIFKLGIRKKIFTQNMRPQHSLPRKMVDDLFLKALKARMDQGLV